MIGNSYGYLTVLGIAHKIGRWKRGKLVATRIYWSCRCRCGNKHVVEGYTLRSGKTKSCGCFQSQTSSERAKKRNYAHGMCGTRFYRIWMGMRYRCTRPKHMHYSRYGGRGIRVEWSTFQEFKRDMYSSYVKHCELHGELYTWLDRINGNGNYSRVNCRWATPKEQRINQERTINLTFKGKTQCLTEWAREIGISYQSLRTRLRKWSLQKALGIHGRSKHRNVDHKV